MHSVQMDLGGLELAFEACGLQLQLSSEAKVAPSVEDDVDSLRERLTQCELNASRTNRPWIVRGSAFRLELSLRFECGLDANRQADLTETLVERLRTAKLWQQLRLTPTSVESSIPEMDSHSITVFLAYDETNERGSKRKLHQLGDESTFNDVRPPAGVPTAVFDCVYLTICLQRTAQRKRRKLRRRRSEPSTPGHPIESLSTPSNISDVETKLPLNFLTAESSDLRATTGTSSASSANELLMDSEDEETHDEDACMLFNRDVEGETNLHHIFRSTPSFLKRISSASDLVIDDTAACKHATLNLIDAAIRMAIMDCRRDLGKGITLTATNSIRHLAEFDPALWLPGHRTAVASRAILLPTVSHALETVCSRQSKSQRLISKIQGLYSARVHADRAVEGTSSTLWQSVQRALYNLGAGKRLIPLSVATNASSADAPQPEELLEWNDGSYYRAPVHDTEGSMLLEDESVEDSDEFKEDISEADLLSVCESLDSLSLLESDIEDPNDSQPDEDFLDGHEMLCI